MNNRFEFSVDHCSRFRRFRKSIQFCCRAYAGDDRQGSAYLQALALSLKEFYKTLSIHDIYRAVINMVSGEDQVSGSSIVHVVWSSRREQEVRFR